MKICYIYRKSMPGRHSIENVFNTIYKEIENKENIEIERLYHDKSLWRSVLSLWKIKADIYHITGDVHYLALFLPRKKTVLTIHDIGAFKNKKRNIKGYFYLLVWFILPIFWLKKITAISEHTKNDLITILNIHESKIITIDNPLSLKTKFVKHNIRLTPTILQIGSGSHKNLERLIDAVKDIDCKLIIIGNPDIRLIQKLKNFTIKYEVFYNISDKEIVRKYEESDILFFASLTEGFGLPIIEAQATGRVVITSNIPPMIDVSGGFAELVDPYSVTEIKDGIKRIINDCDYRQYLIKGGLKNAKQYSAIKIAEKYIDLYKNLIEN